jgi:hypothetical protein
MSTNPYSPPESQVLDQAPAEFAFSIAVVGMLVGTGAAYILVLLYGNLTQWALIATGVDPDNLSNAVATSPFVNAATHVINICSAAVGGYWSARLAPGKPLHHAATAGALMLIPVGIAFLAPYEMAHPRWSLALLFITPIPSACAGAWWWQRQP